MKLYDTPTIQSEGREIQISREETSRTKQSHEGTGKAQRTKGGTTRPIPALTEKNKRNFDRKVKFNPETGCLEWQGSRHEKLGYGRFGVKGHLFYAHRIAYFRETGNDPGVLYCLHRCDNPRCCSVSHLWLGTIAENNQDRGRKGRGNSPCGENHGSYTKPESTPRGSGNGNAKLTEAQAIKIRSRYADGGITYLKLGVEYGVHPTLIGYIIRRKIWNHVA